MAHHGPPWPIEDDVQLASAADTARMLNVRHHYCYCSWICLMLCAYFSNAGFVDDIDANKTFAYTRTARTKRPMAARSQNMLGRSASNVSYGHRRMLNSGTMLEPGGSMPQGLAQGLTAGYRQGSHDQRVSSFLSTNKSVIYLHRRMSNVLINSKMNRQEVVVSSSRSANKDSGSENKESVLKLLGKAIKSSQSHEKDINMEISPSPKSLRSARSLVFLNIHHQGAHKSSDRGKYRRFQRDVFHENPKTAVDSHSESAADAEMSTSRTVAMDSTTPEVNVSLTTRALQRTLVLTGSRITTAAPTFQTVQHKAISITSLKNKVRQANDMTDQAAPAGNKWQQGSRSLQTQPTDVSEVVSIGHNMGQNASLTNLHILLLSIASLGAVTLLLINLAGVLCCKRLLRVKRPVSTTPIIDDLFPNAPTQRRLFLRRFSTPSTLRSDLRAPSGVAYGVSKHMYKDEVDLTTGRGRSNSAFTRSYNTHF